MKDFIDFEVGSVEIDDSVLRELISNAHSYQDTIDALSYLLSHIFEARSKNGVDCVQLIETLYQLTNDMDFNIHELDTSFVAYLLRCERNPALTLEEEIILAQNKKGNYEYGRKFRT